jgi:hypothetical protein
MLKGANKYEAKNQASFTVFATLSTDVSTNYHLFCYIYKIGSNG